MAGNELLRAVVPSRLDIVFRLGITWSSGAPTVRPYRPPVGPVGDSAALDFYAAGASDGTFGSVVLPLWIVPL